MLQNIYSQSSGGQTLHTNFVGKAGVYQYWGRELKEYLILRRENKIDVLEKKPEFDIWGKKRVNVWKENLSFELPQFKETV